MWEVRREHFPPLGPANTCSLGRKDYRARTRNKALACEKPKNQIHGSAGFSGGWRVSERGRNLVTSTGGIWFFQTDQISGSFQKADGCEEIPAPPAET